MSVVVDLGLLKGSAVILPQGNPQHRLVLPCGTDTLKAMSVDLNVICTAFTWSLLRLVRVVIKSSIFWGVVL